MGVELASLGINLNFAPTVDIDSNPRNPVIGPRAFGRTADEVIPAAHAFLTAMERDGVLGCPKHYPGHGDTPADSHHALPVVDADLATLRSRELQPFASLARDASMIMTAHVRFPAIDPVSPATMSARLIRSALREELGLAGRGVR